MALKKKPVTGMKDMLPREMEIRDYLIGLIKETYKTYGFCSIETPCVEHIENLCSKQGGDNEKLIFKILKRGEKLKLDTAECEADLVDSGLRYDLTVPLSRYYSNNAGQLPTPFKALQMGNVWRADRPQRGRFRQFMQCDIDILGEPTYLAEIELVMATTTLLGKLDFHNFTIRINDRKILKAMAQYSGFPEGSFDTVFIILDKMDKIGLEGVAEELEKEGFSKDSIDTYLGMFKEFTTDIGFKVFKIDSTNFKEWETSYDYLEKSVKQSAKGEYTTYKTDRTELDLVYEIMLKQNFMLTEKLDIINTSEGNIYKVANGITYIFLNKVTTSVVDKIIELKKEVQAEYGLENPTVILNEAYIDTGIKANALLNFKSNGITNIITV